MANHSSAPVRETPHTIVDALKRRAQAVLNDRSIDPPSRMIIRYALETNDPWLGELVRLVDAGETVVYAAGFLKTSAINAFGVIKLRLIKEETCRS